MASSRLPRSTVQFSVGDGEAFAKGCDQSATASSILRGLQVPLTPPPPCVNVKYS